MKLYFKIFIIPIILMVVVFFTSIVLIENHLKSSLTSRFEQVMKTLSYFAQSSVVFLPNNQTKIERIKIIDKFANELAKKSAVRVSFFSKKGLLLGDSLLSFKDIVDQPSYLNEAELIEAKKNTTAYIKRYSSRQKTDVLYLVNYDNKNQFFTRIALPANRYVQILAQLRQDFILIVLIVITIVVFLGFTSLRLISAAVQKERKIQQAILVAKTREATLIQTMTTLLSQAESIECTATVLKNMLSEILPSYSGAVFFMPSVNNKPLKLIAKWGKYWQDLPETLLQCWSENNAVVCIDREHKTSCEKSQCKYYQQAMCINLFDDKSYIGLLHLYADNLIISDEDRKIAESIAEQIGFAFSNLLIKEDLRNQATKDPLTGIYNRRFMLESFESILHISKRHERSFAVLMVDLDHFKMFNDRFGHEAGDIVLKKVSEAFKYNLRLEDVACRYGGEEFLIICPDTNLRDAYLLAEKLRGLVSAIQLQHEERSLGQITMSIGLALFPNHANTCQDLILKADKALYSAKARGRNCTVVAQASTQGYRQKN